MEEASPSWAYIAISHNRAEEVQRRLGVKCNTIPNGICLKTTLGLPEELSEFAETSGCWDADYVLFHPCRLVRRKKIETGIRVVKALTEFGRSTRYLITAAVDPHRPESAAYFEELKSLVRSLGVEREVHFLWEHFPISSEVLRGLYAVSDGLFFPGLQEGFGLPLLEATASRLPAFCPNGEPMNQLPGAVCWPSSWTPERIAHWLIRQIETRHPIQARKNLVRSYRWASIYRNFLAPLFHQPQHRNP
jgi:glycosyltransferase involved in cell wall biosynthesis